MFTEEMKLANRLKRELPKTYSHGERTAMYAGILAEASGMAESVESIKEAALLHDIGKLFVPKELLEKPGTLTPLEKAAVDRHTSMDILSLLDFDSPFVRYVCQYHHSSSGSMIPECRVIAVADVFDALTSDRVYQGAIPWKKAIEIMKTDDRNSNLDPAYVELLSTTLEREYIA